MHRHLKKILFILLLLGCCLAHSINAEAWQHAQKMQVQSDQQPEATTEEATSPTEEEQEQYSDEEYSDEEYTDEEQSQSPFPEIITPPKRAERKIADDKWLKLTSDEDFRYEDTKPKVKNEEISWWTKMFMNIFSFFASTAGNIVIIAIVALIVLVIVVRIVQLNGNVFFSKKDKKLGVEVADELSDEYVPDDWEKVIQEAAKAGNYRLAVRHGYRYLLSLLQEKNIISFQVAKTNYQYVFELAGTQLHKPFMQLTRDYEYAWYGGFNIEEERFQDYYHKVTSIKKELDQKG